MICKTSRFWTLWLAAAVGLGATACAGDDSEPSGSGGAGSGGAAASGGTGGGGASVVAGPALMSCETFCVKEDACDPDATVDDCKSYRCSGFDEASASCLSALKAFFDCMNVAADPCLTVSCEARELAYHEACG